MSKLNDLCQNSPILNFDKDSKIVLMSDCHRGSGNWGDNFMKNQNLFFAALTRYEKEGFTYIELGDGDELWENRDISQIIQIHSDVFWLLGKLYKKGRFHMLYGNHDNVKKKPKYAAKNFTHYYCETTQKKQPLFPGLTIQESILLRHRTLDLQFLLIHGHQDDFLNDQLGWLASFLVRYFWRPLELAGIHDPTSAAKNYALKNKTEKRLCTWALEHQQPIIAGHTHRPSLPAPNECPYFNCGSCVHPRCITALEIQNDQISLVKWCILTRSDASLYVGKELLEGPVKLTSYLNPKPHPKSS